jgi:DNA anti-recombination protein RmuC
VPVTAKLSLKFYEKLGEEVANELVEWFNSVDATYRSDLRELNDLNFARFDAKLEQRAAELDAKIEQRTAELDAKIEQRTAELDAKIEQRTAELDAKIELRIAELDAKIDRRIVELRAEMREGFARVDQRFAEFEAKLTNRLFAFWVTQAATTVGLVFGIVKLVGR